MYAKLISGTLRSAPKKVYCNGKTIFNPPDTVLQELGYLPVNYTDMPTDVPDGQHYESSWSQTDIEIVQVWTLADDPVAPAPELTIQDLVDAVDRGLNS